MTPRYDTKRQAEMSLASAYADAIAHAFFAHFGQELTADAFGGNWEKNERSRAPYTDAWKMGNRGITLFASPSLMHCCVEISGSGCEELIGKNILNKVLQQINNRVTRIDIACDIETDTRPKAFVAKTNHKRMRASGYQNSSSGETCYVGSQKSDRYARVYRYNPPHPRSNLLRIEHVFRKAYAKRVAYEILAGGIDAVSVATGEAFGWKHPIWQTGKQEGADLSIVGMERSAGKTLFWLCNSVAPAFKRLCADGDIADAQEFLTRYFLSV